jgi:hypothetical protein
MWLFEGKDLDENVNNEYYGFVYIIRNKTNGKSYIGRKYFTKAAVRQVKGKRRKTRKESDWKEYWGSSKNLLEDIEKLGEENFEREILRLCKTRGECNYWEAKYQFEYNVLQSEEYYNDNIMMKFTRHNIGL